MTTKSTKSAKKAKLEVPSYPNPLCWEFPDTFVPAYKRALHAINPDLTADVTLNRTLQAIHPNATYWETYYRAADIRRELWPSLAAGKRVTAPRIIRLLLAEIPSTTEHNRVSR